MFDIFSTKAEKEVDVGVVELIKTPEWPGPGEESALCSMLITTSNKEAASYKSEDFEKYQQRIFFKSKCTFLC